MPLEREERESTFMVGDELDLSSSFILCPICGNMGHGVQLPSAPGSTTVRVDLNKIYPVHRFPMISLRSRVPVYSLSFLLLLTP